MRAGHQLNHYRIIRPLGAGGMGEVYEAEDTRLKRHVAVKLLPPGIASDPDRSARFEREARALASLTHPNIVTIYSVEDAGTTRFLTMEIVDGRTMDRVVPPAGLPLAEFLSYAIPLVDAVAAAHDCHIVHRDLKPGNVMVTRDGRVKVLDFGLAKLTEASGAGATTTTAHATHVGQVVGTVAYMSPEQVDGRALDHRSDIFSLGIVLYEMATGVRPFGGDGSIAVLASILRDTPAPITEIRPGISPELERTLEHCLAKNPENRLQSAKDLRSLLEVLARSPAARMDDSSGRMRVAKAAAGLTLTAAATIGIAYGVASWRRDEAEAPLLRPTFTRLTFSRGVEMSPALSPDGRQLAYAARPPSGGEYDIYIRPTGADTPVNLTPDSTASDTGPAFSPDGSQIAFRSLRDGSAGIFVMGRSGDAVRRLTNGGADPEWTPDGREIVYADELGYEPDARYVPSALWAVNVASGERRRIADADAVHPRVSPDGRYVAFWALPVRSGGRDFASPNRDIWIQRLEGGPRVRITSGESLDWNPAWSPDGRFLYFSSDRSGSVNLWRVAIDGQTGSAVGEPVAITAPTVWAGQIRVGRDGTVAYAAYNFSTHVRSIAFDPGAGTVQGTPSDVVTGQRAWLQPDVSADGRFLTLRSFRGQEDIWVVGVDGSDLRQVTNDPGRDRGSRWMRDGSLLFYSSRSGDYHLWTIQADGTGARQLTHGGTAFQYPLPSPDGRWIGASNPSTGEQFLFDARDWTRPPERLPSPTTRGSTYLRDWSPDGTRIAAESLDGLLVFSVEEKTWEGIGAGSAPRWLPDGRRLLATARARMILADTVTRSSREIYAEPDRAISHLALAPDGRRVYFTSAIVESDIWLMRFNP